MKKTNIFKLFSITLLTAFGVSGCNNGDSGLSGEGTPPELPESVTQLVVTPKSESVPVGIELPLKAEAIFTNGDVVDVTTRSEVTWSSSDDSIATVSDDGTLLGKTSGTVTITAKGVSNGKEYADSTSIEVTNAIVTNLEVLPLQESTPVGLSKQFQALAYFSDNRPAVDVTEHSAVSWESSDASIASLDANQKGQVKGEAVGTATIRASGEINGVVFQNEASIDVTAAVVTSIEVSPSEDVVPVGLSKQFTAKAYFSDNRPPRDITDDPAVTWRSSAPDVATVDNETDTDSGTVKGRATGIQVSSSPVTITASGQANGVEFSDSADLKVSDAIITSIVVTPDGETLPKGLSKSFSAKAYFSDEREPLDVTQDPLLNWRTSDSQTATVDNNENKGAVTGVQVGNVDVIASTTVNEEEISGKAALTVSAATLQSITIEPTSLSVALDADSSGQLTAMGHYSDESEVPLNDSVVWSGYDTDIATIDTDGVVRGVSLGETTTFAQLDGIDSDEASIIIHPYMPICGGVIDDTDRASISGTCVKVTSDDSGNLFSAPPNSKILDVLGYTSDDSDNNAGDTYAKLEIEPATFPLDYPGMEDDFMFATFRHDGALVVNPGEGMDELAGVNGQLDRWCQKLSTLNFAGKSNWQRTTAAQVNAWLEDILARDIETEDSNVSGFLADSMYIFYGWPVQIAYGTRDVRGTKMVSAHLWNMTAGASSGSPENPVYPVCIAPVN